jgi:4-hydroxy-tetrahydrodipicolinate reductase
MTDIILNGCSGKMGKAVTSCVSERNDCRIVCGVDLNTEADRDYPIVSKIKEAEKGDVIIDFSHPSSLPALLEYAVTTKTPVVFATTGLSDADIDNIKEAAKVIPVFFTFNMSLGINLLCSLAVTASKILGEQYDVEIVEKHHNQKIDAPSGTAIMLANAVNNANNGKYEYTYDRHSKREKRNKNEIGLHAVRGGTIVGEHEVIFAGRDEVVTLSHSAYSKEVFAVGAVNAALFIANLTPGLYDMADLIKNK